MIEIIKPLRNKNVLISACLLGINCKYDGKNNKNIILSTLINLNYFVPIIICPEQLGGLPTPRIPAEIQPNQSVINKFGNDVTCFFKKGAEESLKIANFYNIETCMLKENSPSCGVKNTYDGTFTNTKINSQGITSSLLSSNNYKIISSDNIRNKPGLVLGLFEEYYQNFNLDELEKQIEQKGGFIIK